MEHNMRIVSVVLLMILSSSWGQGRQAEATVHFRAGNGEQFVTSCRAIDEVERSVGSAMPMKDLLEEFKKSGTCMGLIQGVIDSDTIAHTDKSGHPDGRNLCVPTSLELRWRWMSTTIQMPATSSSL